jgi:hypothetical protein
MRRALASLLMLWFAVTTADPAALHQCEMHAGTHAAADPASVEAGADLGAGTDEHAGHDMSSAEESETPPADATHHCTCLSECCSALVTAVPSQPVASFAPLSVRREVRRSLVESAESAQPGLRLPFATAPPALPGTLS